MKRSADESQISVLLKDFEDADLLLAKVGKIHSGHSIHPRLYALDRDLTAGCTDHRRRESMA